MQFKIFGLLFFSILTSFVNLWAQNDLAKINPDTATTTSVPLDAAAKRKLKQTQINEFMKELYETNQFNGSVLVADREGVMFKNAYGWSNIYKRDTMTTDTPVRLASVSKQFTAMAIMILKERGKLSYEDEIAMYLPELAHYQGVTIRHLLQHSSGLPDYFGIGFYISQYFAPGKLIMNRDLLKYFSETKPKLHFKPGKRASYSNTGYVFLALIVERIANEYFPSFLQKNIFEPAGMKNAFVYNTNNKEIKISYDTTFVKSDTVFVNYNEMKIEAQYKVTTRIKTVEKRRAYGYEMGLKGDLLPLDYHQFDGMYGEKGVSISADELYKWHLALLENKIVKPETLKEAFTPADVSDRREWKYGFGWKIFSEDYNIVFHHGLYRGFRTYLQRNLNDQSFMVILSNVQIGRKMVGILDGLNRILDEKSYKVPKPSKIEKDAITKFRETYRIEYSGGGK
ncbi:MAG: beta-lactamase family protein [Microscillaceae bacterium]|jgi:CubicO group peptidase (beta-lactamase class C family)|nr:beta-lactamase family protein [Microscillaceae bacterium]